MWNITETNVKSEDGGAVTTYGIRCGETVINDLTASKEEIEQFVGLLNSCGASEIHAYDLAEDFLGK